MKVLSNSKRFDLKVIVKDFLRKLPNIEIELVRIDDYFYHEPKSLQGKTNKEGIIEFKSLLQGCYLVRVLKQKQREESGFVCDEMERGKILATRIKTFKLPQIEKIKIIDKDDSITINLPILFNWVHREEKLISDTKKEELYEKFRTDKDFCFKCKKEYKDLLDRFNCNYCKKYHCTKCRLPEDHNCWGHPKAPPVDIRVRYGSGRSTTQ